MKKLTAILAALLLGLTLGACNTVKGVGKDVEKGGEAIQKAGSGGY